MSGKSGSFAPLEPLHGGLSLKSNRNVWVGPRDDKSEATHRPASSATQESLTDIESDERRRRVCNLQLQLAS
jgi:hypothetical protein